MSYLDKLFAIDGKTAVVIGGSGVLGGAMAEGLARAGANVAILGRTMAKAETRAQYLKDECNCDAIAVQVDASDYNSLRKARDEVLQCWKRIDILINAPGMTSTTPFFEIKEEE